MKSVRIPRVQNSQCQRLIFFLFLLELKVILQLYVRSCVTEEWKLLQKYLLLSNNLLLRSV